MANHRFPFLSPLSQTSFEIANLREIILLSDAAKRLILATGSFSVKAYSQTDFAHLKLDFPESIKNAVLKRQAEYLAGRYLSHLAMRQSGLFNFPPPQLGSGKLREPAWPQVLTGSITHHQNKACVAVLTQPLSSENFVGIDTEIWLTAQQASEIAESIHNTEELQLLLNNNFTNNQATSLLFSAKEALFKAICPFVGKYFGFKAARLIGYLNLAERRTTSIKTGWLKLELVDKHIIERAPQRIYHCWFSCNEYDVITLISSDTLCTPWIGASS